jgi:hypothetical protein
VGHQPALGISLGSARIWPDHGPAGALADGVDPRRIWPGVCPADTELFGAARADRHGMPDAGHGALRIGFAGKLIGRMSVDELLSVAALLQPGRAWRATRHTIAQSRRSSRRSRDLGPAADGSASADITCPACFGRPSASRRGLSPRPRPSRSATSETSGRPSRRNPAIGSR